MSVAKTPQKSTNLGLHSSKLICSPSTTILAQLSQTLMTRRSSGYALCWKLQHWTWVQQRTWSQSIKQKHGELQITQDAAKDTSADTCHFLTSLDGSDPEPISSEKMELGHLENMAEHSHHLKFLSSLISMILANEEPMPLFLAHQTHSWESMGNFQM